MAPASSASQRVEVSWTDIDHLLDAHPGLAVGALQIEAARRGVDVAGAVPNPTLEGNLGQGFARTGGGSGVEWGLALNVPLDWIARRGSRISAAEAAVEVAVAERQALRRDVELQLKTLYWSLVHEQALVESLGELEAQSAALVHTVGMRVDTGEVRPVEVTRVEIEFHKISGESEAAYTLLAARQAQLALWLGVRRGTTIVAIADLTALPVVIDLDTALDRLRATHPDLLTARARLRALQAEVETEKMARVPAISLIGHADDELDRRAYGVGLAVDLPLFNWNVGSIGQAEAMAAAGRQRVEQVERDLEDAVIEGHAACLASIQTATRLGTQVVPRAEDAATTMEKTYMLGELNLIELIDARRTLNEARRLHLDALAQAHIDCSRLDALVPEEPR
ncbi:MAG: TolC family protein [Pseudomonadota bacterium]